MTDFTLPELGENIASGDVLRVLVKPGDTIAKDQAVVELETDKATIEVPSSVAGQVKDVKVKPGDKVKVGQAILSVDDGAQAAPKQADAKAEPAKAEAKSESAKSESATSEPAKSEPAKAEAKPEAAKEAKEDAQVAPKPAAAQATLAKADDKTPDEAEPNAGTPASVPPEQKVQEQPDVQAKRRPAESDKSGVKDEDDSKQPAAPAPRDKKVVDISRGARTAAEPAAPDMPPAPAAPSVRRMARELGVDIGTVSGSGPSGRISVDDVKAHARQVVSGAGTHGGAPALTSVTLPDFSRWGEIDRQPMRAVRRKTAEHLSAAWATIPHVTQHDAADITQLEELRKKYAKQAEASGGNLTVTAIAVKVVASALKVFPQFNTSIDLANDAIIFKKYVHIGVAVDTDRGLLVPVIRDADTKNILRLAAELAELSEKARNRKLSLEEMQGGCFSISNLGGIGGTSFTPIVNAPEVAILGISRARMEPVYRGPASGEFYARLMLPLSLSYDHRAIDGADGARFLRWVAEAFEQPFLLALQG
jgi:pyruvate dehydrogenase E2 component (dihydrolipoamide acetyltransferase)